MKTTVEIRPEQAAQLIALTNEAKAAAQRRDVALTAVLAGLFDGQAMVETIHDDGRVVVVVPDKEEDSGAAE